MATLCVLVRHAYVTPARCLEYIKPWELANNPGALKPCRADPSVAQDGMRTDVLNFKVAEANFLAQSGRDVVYWQRRQQQRTKSNPSKQGGTVNSDRRRSHSTQSRRRQTRLHQRSPFGAVFFVVLAVTVASMLGFVGVVASVLAGS